LKVIRNKVSGFESKRKKKRKKESVKDPHKVKQQQKCKTHFHHHNNNNSNSSSKSVRKHKSVAADLTSRMAEHFVAVGKTARPTGMACAQAQRIRALIRVHGIMDLKCLAFTRGPGELLCA